MLRSLTVVGLVLLLASCRNPGRPPTALRGTNAFTTAEFGCPMASPMHVTSQGADVVLIPSTDGTIRAFDGVDGTPVFSRVATPGSTGGAFRVSQKG